MLNTRKGFLLRALLGRAEVQELLGRYQVSMDDFKEIAEKTEDSDMVIESLGGTANIYLRIGDMHTSEHFYRKGIKLAKEKKRKVKSAMLLNGLSLVKMEGAETDGALRYTNQALAIYNALSGSRKEKKQGIAECFNNLGGIFSSIGAPRKALKFYKKSLSMRKHLKDKEGTAINLNNIGIACMDIEEYDKSLEFLQRSLLIRKEIGFVRGIATCSGNIGIVYWKKGWHEKAMNYFLENMRIQKKLGDKQGIANNLNSIGIVYKTHGEFDKSLACHRESLKIRKETGDKFGMTINLNQIGRI